MIIVFVILGAGATLVSGAFTYSIILKPHLKTIENKKLLLRYAIILGVIALGGAAILWYVMRDPDYFEEGIDQLHESQYVQSKIGDFNSYSYYPAKFPKNPTKVAVFQVTILGDKLHLFLTCTMNRVGNEWKLTTIKEDSVHNVTL